ncbi:hypothetical protein [Terrarubrum flagellatum]|uniref:OmpA family protein n=1 Tax=Terrirubrum flagellatum TaxID=2895980 RepID=UPI0031453BD4
MGEVTTLWSTRDAIGARLSHFSIGSDVLRPAHISFIQGELGRRLRQNGSVHLLGLASRSGGAAFNRELSRRRANAVLAQLRSVAGNNFKHLSSEAGGESAAALAGAKDGAEDPNWRAVIIFWWSRLEPPPTTRPPPPKLISRSVSKTVWGEESGSKSFGDRGDSTFNFSRQILGIWDPDSRVADDGKKISVPDDYVVTGIHIKLHQASSSLPTGVTSQWYEVTFAWGSPIGLSQVDVYDGTSLSQTVSPKSAMEIYEHPGHYLLRPHR